MVDKVVEFINRSGLTYADLKAGVPLVAPAAGQQAVIKDLYLTGSVRPLSLQVGNVEVLSGQAPARYSGSEIVGEGTSAVLKSSINPVFNSLVFFDNGYRACVVSGKTLFQGEASLSNNARMAFTGSAYSSQTPYFYCQAVNGDTYNANGGRSSGSYTQLFRRAQGYAAPDITVTTQFFCGCFDGSRYIYGIVSNTAIVSVDTTAATPVGTNIPLIGVDGKPYTASFNTNYNTMAAVDGWVFIISSQTLYMIEGATGKVLSFDTTALGSSPANTSYALGVTKNQAGEYIVVRGLSITKPNNTATSMLGAVNLGKVLSVNTVVKEMVRFDCGQFPASQNNSTNLILPITGAANGTLIGTDMVSAPTIYLINVDSYTVTSFPSGVSVGQSGIFCAYAILDQTQVARDFGTVNVRATGVLSVS